jgi:cell division protein FtsI/penicillin-binding protein 2
MQFLDVSVLNNFITPCVNYTGGCFMSKRIITLTSLFAFVFTAIIGRCGYVALSKTYTVSDTYNSYTINISTLNPYIYDRKGEKLNNNTTSYVAIIRPNEKCLSELDLLFTDDEIKEITNELSNGYPIIKDVSKKVNTKYIQIVEKINENDTNARHILDYSCSGLEKYTNYDLGQLYVNFPVDATGRLLNGDNYDIVSNNYDSTDGVIISIDKQIQEICEQASQSINYGAVVVMNVENSQILASVSRGEDYNNRALSHYAVGSVFKLVVCASAIESNIQPIYKCESKITIGDTTFNCQNNKSHGVQNMKQALANSCNCYFVNLAIKLGADKLYSTAKSLGFGEYFNLYNDWEISAGNMPSLTTLNSLGQLALLGFGQGQLTDSPIHFASVISCIANGGNYNYPTLDIENSIDNNVFSKDTAKTILEYMHYVVTNGTGANANYKDNTAGKTATAQSGVYVDGEEVLNTWFAGVYPYNNPKYAIVVMCENGTSGAGDCCPVFRTIVEKLENM